jgi:hypothetical protein
MLSALTIGAFLAENLLYFPLSVPYMKDLAAGAPLLDMRPGYTPDAAYHLFEVLGQGGRGTYLKLLWTVDLLLPALFGLFLSSAMVRGAFGAWRAVPLVGAACDYAENVAITILLVRYPMRADVLVAIAAIFTVTKLTLYASGLILAVAGYVARVAKTPRQVRS